MITSGFAAHAEDSCARFENDAVIHAISLVAMRNAPNKDGMKDVDGYRARMCSAMVNAVAQSRTNTNDLVDVSLNFRNISYMLTLMTKLVVTGKEEILKYQYVDNSMSFVRRTN